VVTASNTLIDTYETSISGVGASITQSCTFKGTTEATCAATLIAAYEGQTTSTATTTSYSTASGLQYTQVPITAGADKLSSSSSTAKASSHDP